MEYVSSCQAIGIWEDLCVQGVVKGYARLAHDGKVDEDISVYTRVYHLDLKSSIQPVPIKFWYDRRIKDKSIRKDVAGVKIHLDDLILILEAVGNREIKIDMPDFSLTKDRDGLKIVHKEQ